MTLHGRVNRLEQTARDDPAGCQNCRPIPDPVEIFDGEPDSQPLPCLNPSNCPGGVRQIVIRHIGSKRGERVE
jgi:hypothetical protein